MTTGAEMEPRKELDLGTGSNENRLGVAGFKSVTEKHFEFGESE